MCQESTKEPAFGLKVGCDIVAAVYMKKGLESFGKASFPHASKPLFQFAKANPQGKALRTAALVTCAEGGAVFAAAKTSGFRAAAREEVTPAAAGYTSSPPPAERTQFGIVMK